MPMNGKSKEEIEQNLQVARRTLAPSDVICGYIEGHVPKPVDAKNEGIYFLSRSLKILSGCDAICYTEEAFHSRGCGIEIQVAREYGMTEIMMR